MSVVSRGGGEASTVPSGVPLSQEFAPGDLVNSPPKTDDNATLNNLTINPSEFQGIDSGAGTVLQETEQTLPFTRDIEVLGHNFIVGRLNVYSFFILFFLEIRNNGV